MERKALKPPKKEHEDSLDSTTGAHAAVSTPSISEMHNR